jgi:hypothetical protein
VMTLVFTSAPRGSLKMATTPGKSWLPRSISCAQRR